jgi:hypothetical protein
MEIKQGKTVAQLVEYLYSEYGPVSTENIHIKKAECFDMIVNYVQICSTKFHKGQFIPCDDEGNEIEKPIGYIGAGSEKAKLLKQYQEAESKVIFKGVEKTIHDGIKVSDWSIEVYENGNIYYFDKRLTTIGELFEATNGEIETQNINI